MPFNLKKYQTGLPGLVREVTVDEEYLVPTLVGDVADLLGIPARAKVEEWNPTQVRSTTEEYFTQLVIHTAALLSYYGIEKIDDDLRSSVTSRLSKLQDVRVSLLARADRMYRAYILEEPEHTRMEAQRLWATLEDRSKQLFGKSLAEFLEQ